MLVRWETLPVSFSLPICRLMVGLLQPISTLNFQLHYKKWYSKPSVASWATIIGRYWFNRKHPSTVQQPDLIILWIIEMLTSVLHRIRADWKAPRWTRRRGTSSYCGQLLSMAADCPGRRRWYHLHMWSHQLPWFLAASPLEIDTERNQNFVDQNSVDIFILLLTAEGLLNSESC